MGVSERAGSSPDEGLGTKPAGLVNWRVDATRVDAPDRIDIQPRTVGRYSGIANLDWLQCAQRLTPGQCDLITAIGESFTVQRPSVVGEQSLPEHRVGDVHFIPCTRVTQPIYHLLWEVACDAAERHYDFRLSGITRMPHYVRYRQGYGHFHWHNDYSHEAMEAPRKLTVIIQLSESGDYEGGDLQVFNVGPETLPRDRGTILCLPSFAPHRVTPVTAGSRRVLVAWIAGPRLR